MSQKTVFVTGANGYVGNAVARAFARAGWVVYGLIRTAKPVPLLASEEIIPIIGAIDDVSSHQAIADSLPRTLDALVSTTEMAFNYVPHYTNTVALLRTVARRVLHAGNPKPLLLFTSGCKDYGVGPHIHGTPDLTPHTEDSPIKAPPPLVARAENAVRIFDNADVVIPVLLRPTNVYGRSSSFYAGFFEVAAKAAASGAPIVIPAAPEYVLHALHVDDCADAYVALAEHQQRSELDGEVFNISACRYETVDEVCQALAREYGVVGGLQYVNPADHAVGGNPWPPALVDFPQWTGSDKIRRVTGWGDRRPLFSEALGVYRGAFEAAGRDALTSRMQERVAAVFRGLEKT